MLSSLITLFAVLALCLGSPVQKRNFGPVTVFDPATSPYAANYYSPGTRYARTLQLTNGDILASWENSAKSPTTGLVYFPVFKSTDNGMTWNRFSNVQDTQNGWGLKWQPFLYQTKQAYGSFPAGTVLMAGNGDTPVTGAQCKIDLYASQDLGLTWTFVANIASGGRAVPEDGYPAIWEPFLLEYNGNMLIYYSDQRDRNYSQKLVYTSSSDLVNWSATVDVVTEPVQTMRPGMAVVSKMGNGQYLLTYEFGGSPLGNFATYYKVSSDPTQFAAVNGTGLVATDGSVPTSSPYNVWANTGGSGQVVVNAASHASIFVNYNYGQGQWLRYSTPSPAAYSRCLEVLQNGQLLIAAGGPNSVPNGTLSKVQVTSLTFD